AHPDGPRVERSYRVRAPRHACRARRRRRADRYQDRREFSYAASSASVPAEPVCLRRSDASDSRCRPHSEPRLDRPRRDAAPGVSGQAPSGDRLPLVDLARVTTESLEAYRPSYIRLPLGWPGEFCRFAHPLDYIGFDGSGGIGSGPGMAVGAALALRGGDRLPVAVLGDGDYLMGLTALWTGVHYRVPLLIIV